MCIWRAERKGSQHWASCPLSPRVPLNSYGGWDEVSLGRQRSDSLPLCYTYLPDFLFFAQVRHCLIAPIREQTALSTLLTFTVKKKEKNKPSQAALTRISCTGWLDPPKKIWKQDKIVKRFGETWDSSERWAPALARGINILTNHSTQRKL